MIFFNPLLYLATSFSDTGRVSVPDYHEGLERHWNPILREIILVIVLLVRLWLNDRYYLSF